MAPQVADVVVAAATVGAVAAFLILMAYVVRRLGRGRSRLSERGVDWATSLGISGVLSVVLSLVMVTINVGLTGAFPAAFLNSVLIGVVVATPTAYVVFPWVRRLTEPLAAPAAPTASDPGRPAPPS